MADNLDAPHFIYFADPMCSWCYGFAPVIVALAKQFEGRLPVRLVMGGLRAGETRPMREKDFAYIATAWSEVAAASGQSFDRSFLDRKNFVYNTEPACRAVVTMRRRVPQLALAFTARVASAFYADNRDVTQGEVLADLAAEAGQDRDSFFADLTSADARNETFRDFMVAKEAGIEGFPLLAAGRQTTGYALITHGFRPIDGLVEAVEDWLAKGEPVTART